MTKYNISDDLKQEKVMKKNKFSQKSLLCIIFGNKKKNMLAIGERKMNLKGYIYSCNMTINEFAAKINCNRAYFSRLINGHVKPGKRLAADIERATNGDVKAEDLLSGGKE